MPCQARIEVPGIPMHVTQAGLNRRAILLDDDDRHHYRRLLREACTRHAVLLSLLSRAKQKGVSNGNVLCHIFVRSRDVAQALRLDGDPVAATLLCDVKLVVGASHQGIKRPIFVVQFGDADR